MSQSARFSRDLNTARVPKITTHIIHLLFQSCITQVLSTINSFIVRINGKYEIEKYIFTKNKNLQKLMDKWTL